MHTNHKYKSNLLYIELYITIYMLDYLQQHKSK